MHQYFYFRRGKTIHSSLQLESYGNDVNDKSIKIQGGKQRVKTLDGFIIPLDVISGLPYMQLRPYTDDEWGKLPTVIMTSGDDWDPSILDYSFSEKDNWKDELDANEGSPHSVFFL